MTGKHRDVHARRVVTGLDEHGRSTIVSDDLAATRLEADAFTLNHIWKSLTVPDNCLQENALGSEVLIPPPPAGFTYLISTFPPDSEWDFDDSGQANLPVGGHRISPLADS